MMFKGITWNPDELLSAKRAMSAIFTIYGIDELWTAVHECNFGSLDTYKVIEELDPEFYDCLAENAEMAYC